MLIFLLVSNLFSSPHPCSKRERVDVRPPPEIQNFAPVLTKDKLNELEATVLSARSSHGVSLTKGLPEAIQALKLLQDIRGAGLNIPWEHLENQHQPILEPVLRKSLRKVESDFLNPFGDPKNSVFQKTLKEFREQEMQTISSEFKLTLKKKKLTVRTFNRLLLQANILTHLFGAVPKSTDELTSSINSYKLIVQRFQDPDDLSSVPLFREGSQLVNFGMPMFWKRNFLIFPGNDWDLGAAAIAPYTAMGAIPLAQKSSDLGGSELQSPLSGFGHELYHLYRNRLELDSKPKLFSNYYQSYLDWYHGKQSADEFALNTFAIHMWAFELWQSYPPMHMTPANSPCRILST